MNITSNKVENFTGLLTFTISNVGYFLDNSIISSIIKPDNISLPGITETSKYSLLHVGNKSIPLIDLKKKFEGKEQKLDLNSRVIIIEYMNAQFGLLVEKVNEIIALDSESLKKYGEFILKGNSPDYIEGILQFENRELLLPNIEMIIKDIGASK
jgi:chemotaxis signal transduction protein